MTPVTRPISHTATAARLAIALLACAAVTFAVAPVASAAPNEFKVGDKVEAEYYVGQWTEAVVVEVLPEGYQYRVKGDFGNNGKPFEVNVLHSRVRAFTGTTARPVDRERAAGPPLKGKYGCAESVFNGDGYTSETRGFITLLSGNRYRQGKGSNGRYRYRSGVTRFIGGGLDKSKATAIDGKRSRLLITVKFTDGATARWACTRVGKS